MSFLAFSHSFYLLHSNGKLIPCKLRAKENALRESKSVDFAVFLGLCKVITIVVVGVFFGTEVRANAEAVHHALQVMCAGDPGVAWQYSENDIPQSRRALALAYRIQSVQIAIFGSMNFRIWQYQFGYTNKCLTH